MARTQAISSKTQEEQSLPKVPNPKLRCKGADKTDLLDLPRQTNDVDNASAMSQESVTWTAESSVRVSEWSVSFCWSWRGSKQRRRAMATPAWEICSSWTVDDEAESSLADLVTVCDVRSSDCSGLSENSRIRLVPGPEKQSCEVSVRFRQQRHAIHHIYVLSTARTCEVYRQNEGNTDAEYLCTARGKLEAVTKNSFSGEQVSEEKPLYRTEMDLEDPDMCTSVTIRLLSLQEKSHVVIGHVLILVSPGPLLTGVMPTVPAPAGGGGASLGALAPLMLQMAQGFSMPDLRNKMSFISNASSESFPERAQPRGQSHEEHTLRALPLKSAPPREETRAPIPSKSETLLEDVCQRLARLESVCTRIETSLSKTLEAFDKRLQILEIGVDRPSVT